MLVLRRYAPRLAALAAVLILAVTVVEFALKIEVPKAVPVVLLALCMAGLMGTVAAEGTGRVSAMPPESQDT